MMLVAPAVSTSRTRTLLPLPTVNDGTAYSTSRQQPAGTSTDPVVNCTAVGVPVIGTAPDQLASRERSTHPVPASSVVTRPASAVRAATSAAKLDASGGV